VKIRTYKLVALALIGLLAPTSLYTPAEAWVNNSVEAIKFGGTGSDSSYAAAQDTNGNMYIGSNFRGAVDFDPTAGFDTRTSNSSISSSNDDIALSKFDSNGDRVWTYSYSGQGADVLQDVKTDSNDNVYIAGYFTYSIDFDPSSGIDSITSTSPAGADCFISKFDSSGAYLWTKTFGNTNIDLLYTMAIDSSDNIFLGGIFSGAVDFNPALAETSTVTATGGYDAFILKLNSDGQHLWSTKFGGGGADYLYGISTGSNGEVFATGYFTSTVDLNPGPGVNNATSIGGADTFLVKLSATGSYIWSTSLGSTGEEYFRSVVVTDTQNNTYLALRAQGNLSFTSVNGSETFTVNGTSDIELFKFSDSGSLLWGRQLIGTATDQLEDIDLDSGSNVYITGAFSGSVYPNPTDSSISILSNGGQDAFIWKMSSSGTYVGYERFGGTLSDVFFDIDITNAAKFIATGSFNGTISIDTGSGAQTYTSSGNSDIFMVRLNTISGVTISVPAEISITSYLASAAKGASHTLTATTNTQGRVVFMANGKRIAKCLSINTTGSSPVYTASCIWTPSIQGSVALTARLIVDSATAVISPPRMIKVQRRSGLR
jgi:hypothetical protein